MVNLKEQRFFNIKDLITVIIFVAGLSGTWFSLQGRINRIEEKVMRTEEILKNNNLELINYKLDALIKSFDSFTAKFDAEYKK